MASPPLAAVRCPLSVVLVFIVVVFISPCPSGESVQLVLCASAVRGFARAIEKGCAQEVRGQKDVIFTHLSLIIGRHRPYASEYMCMCSGSRD